MMGTGLNLTIASCLLVAAPHAQGETPHLPASTGRAQGGSSGLAANHDGLRVLGQNRFVAGASRLFLDNTFVFLDDVVLETAPNSVNGEPWLETASAAFATTGAYSHSTGLARQHSLVFDLDEARGPVSLVSGRGALFAVQGEATVAESTTPSWNWVSDAGAESHYSVTFALANPHRYSLTGRLIASPDPSPITGSAIIEQEGIEDFGVLSISLDTPQTQVLAHGLDLSDGDQVLDVNESGVLQPGTYTFTALANVGNDKGPGYRAGKGEARFGALLDLVPLTPSPPSLGLLRFAPRNEAVDEISREEWLRASGWRLPDPPLELCSGPILPAAFNGLGIDVRTHLRRVSASSSFTDGSTAIDRAQESALAEGNLSFLGTVSARSAAPPDTPATVDSFAHQTSEIFLIGIPRASGAAGVRSRGSSRMGALSGQASAQSEFSIDFEAATTSTVELNGLVEANLFGSAPLSIGRAAIELARIDAEGNVLQVVRSQEVGNGPLTDCVEINQTLVLAPGFYRLSAEAMAHADLVGDEHWDSSVRFDVQLRAIAN